MEGDIEMKEKLIEILLDINSDVDYENEDSLIDGEIIDSVELMQIIAEMEDNFDISIDMEDIIPENFNSIDSMLMLIEKLQND